MSEGTVPWARIAAFAFIAALIGGVLGLVRGGPGLPDQPQPIAWDRQPCAHCQMLVGEARSAAQVITVDGDVLAFDDPGCALRYLADAPPVHRAWFRHAERDAWLPLAEVGFRTGGTTPMGSGLLAVEAGSPGALGVAAARARVLGAQAHGQADGATHAARLVTP